MGHSSRRMIDEHYGKWISKAATGMAQFVSERLGISERLVSKWGSSSLKGDTGIH
jgi:integrase